MEPDLLGDLYQEIILDHSRNPMNQRELPQADICGEAVNPFCGDETRVQVQLEAETASAVGGSAIGCAISQAARSLMTQRLIGASIADMKTMDSLFRSLMDGKSQSEEELERLGDLTVLSSVRRYPVRIKCALLPWLALEEGIEDYLKESSQ
jgi:nitrogen fixation NifU-like protein